MLQVIFTIIILFSSNTVFAQSDDVPAFLREEAERDQNLQRLNEQYQQQLYQQQQPQSLLYQQPINGGDVPAFIQKEQEEQQLYQQQIQQLQQQPQYNYQSADPNSETYTLPPAVYQPAPGDVPAFISQQPQTSEEQPVVAEPEKQFKPMDSSEDAIQINFSDDQYKPKEEITDPTKDEATQYNNTDVKQEEPAVIHSEIPEGAKYEKEDATEATKVEVESTAIPVEDKKETNVLRISYSQEVTELADKDKASLLAVVRLLRSNKSQKVLITANTSERDIGVSTDKIGLMRIIGIRDFLMKQGVDFSQTEVKVNNVQKNKDNIDYIDIDKI
jgi:hypothetical protein